ncbi:hypothetical protein [Chondrinema litorale]|uniref:hypothetical protein n=1 Tax=Chondrinema litorale TaxID=2994555 RepID=UPI00254383EE|nr:hypothetical protein [Chondrinema litorale]UZR93141.1 hypothetical protein OQ292_14875 [Chondrinema litorale]
MQEKEFTIAEIEALNEGLNMVIDHEFENFKLSFRIGNLASNVSQVIKRVEAEKGKIYQKFGEKTKEGHISIQFSSPNYPKFEEALKAVMEEKIKLQVPELQASLFEKEKIKPKFFKLCKELIINDFNS